MEKETKREFTDAEVLAIVKCCRDYSTGCGVCPANVPEGTCSNAYDQCLGRLVEMYEEKCKELKEWQESHAVCIKDIQERGAREAHLDELVRSYQDEYIKSREECDKLHAYNTELHEQLDKTLEIADELEKENKKLKEENEELRTANTHLIQLRDDYRSAMPKLTKANNNLRVDIEDLKKEICMYVDEVLAKDQEIDLLKDANKVLKEKVANYMKTPAKDTLELMKMADFWKGQYEATKKLLDEEKEASVKLRKEIAEREALESMCQRELERQRKMKMKNLADKISDIINTPHMYKIPNKKKYTDKDIAIAVSESLAGFRQSIHNEMGKCLEEFYGK